MATTTRPASTPPTPLATRTSAAAALVLVLLVVAVVATLHLRPPKDAQWWTLVAVGGLFGLYVAGAALVLRSPRRFGTALAVVGGVVLQGVSASVPPRMTDDFLRYAWDGRVQAAGIDPYRYPPGAPQLAHLRDAWLFPDGMTPRLNHPDDRTIYPPVSQAWFWLVHIVSGGEGRQVPLQVGAALLAVATSVAVVVVLRRTGGDPRLVVWWAWCPTVVLEAGNNAHIDVLASLLTVCALGAIASRRWLSGGALLGLAVAAKFLPALVAVAVPPRRSLRVGLAAAVALVAVYLPHVAVLGPDVTGFLGGYVSEESRDRFRVLRAVLPDDAATVAAVVVLAVTALLVWRQADRLEAAGAPPRPWDGAAVMVGVTLVVLTPSYSWYALLLVPLVALGARPAWLWVVAAGYPVYFSGVLPTGYGGTRVIAYGAAAVLVAAAYAFRARRARGQVHPTGNEGPGGVGAV